MAVIDASVYIALMNTNEHGYQASWNWLRKVIATGERLSAPVIILAEVAAAISRGMGDQRLAHQIAKNLQNSKLIFLIPISADLASRAAVIAADNQIRGCDAIYVALAEQNGEILVSLDKQQAERGGKVVLVKVPQ